MSTLAPPVILAADDRHLDQIMQVMRTAFDPAWGEGWSASQLGGALAMPGSFARRALDDDGTPLGFSLCRTLVDDCELLLVAVQPHARGRGLGRQLVQAALADARARGCSRMFLEVRENNQSARQLYHESGFFNVGRRPDYYTGASGQRFAAVTMQRNISGQ